MPPPQSDVPAPRCAGRPRVACDPHGCDETSADPYDRIRALAESTRVRVALGLLDSLERAALRLTDGAPHDGPRRAPRRALLDLERHVAELRGMALVTDMVVNEAMGARGPDRGCVLTEDRADALECAANRLTALSLALGRAYGDATSA